MINYIGQDGTIHQLGDTPENTLQHWKYIKKLKVGSRWRYFYTPEEIRAYYGKGKDIAKYAKPQSAEEMQRRANADLANENARYNSTIDPLHRKRLDMMNKNTDGRDLTRDKKFNKNEEQITAENRRHDKAYEKAAKRKERADKYKEISDDIKDRARYAKPQSAEEMRKRASRDFDKEQDRYFNERDRIRRSDRKADRDLAKARKEYDRNRNEKNWNKLSNTRNKARKTYSDNSDAFDANERKHKEQSRKNADREYNAIRYQNAVNRVNGASKKISDIRKDASKRTYRGYSRAKRTLARGEKYYRRKKK